MLISSIRLFKKQIFNKFFSISSGIALVEPISENSFKKFISKRKFLKKL